MATIGVHQVAQGGFGEGTNELYDRVRPSYPAEQLSFIQSILSEHDGPANIVELGSGTGIFTRGILGHPTFGPAIAQLKAIEPSAGMRAQWNETIQDKRCSCYEGTFEATGVEDGWADMVVVAQAWHWCPDFEKALIEIARIMKPDGVLVLTWNLEDADTPWVAQVRNIYESYEQGTPQFRLGLWKKTFEVPSYGELFEPHEDHIVAYTIPTTLDIVADRVLSKSYIALLPTAEKEVVRKAVTECINRGDGRKWIDQPKGIWEYPYTNLAVVMRRK